MIGWNTEQGTDHLCKLTFSERENSTLWRRLQDDKEYGARPEVGKIDIWDIEYMRF